MKQLLVILAFLLALMPTYLAIGAETGPPDSILRVPHAGGLPRAGSVDLSKSNAVGSTVLGTANGGCAGTTANTCLNNILPTQTSNNGLFIQTDGSNTSWQSAPSAPAGAVIPYFGISTPTGWLLANGQAVSRATYAALFAAVSISQSGNRASTGSGVITGLSDTSDMLAGYAVCGTGIAGGATIASVDSGTQITMSAHATATGTATVVVEPYGCGDGSTTFNVPDLRGGIPAGQDNMGGVGAASRLTSTYLGQNPNQLGVWGGAQSHVLTVPELAAHDHGGVTGNNNQSLNHHHSWGAASPGSLTVFFGGGFPNGAASDGSFLTSDSGDLVHSHNIPSAGTNTPHSIVNPVVVSKYLIKY